MIAVQLIRFSSTLIKYSDSSDYCVVCHWLLLYASTANNGLSFGYVSTSTNTHNTPVLFPNTST